MLNINLVYQFNGFETILILALLIMIGHAFGKLAERIKLPEVTGFIIAGIIINFIAGYLLNYSDELHGLAINFEVVTTIALGFISFILGTKLFIPKIKKHLKVILVTLFFQLLLVVSLTTLLFYFAFPDKLWLAVLISGISAATASAPVIEITKKLRSRGPLTSTLLPLVGLDNILGTIIFLFTTVIAYFLKTNESFYVASLFKPLLGIIVSILIGGILGFIMILIERSVLAKYRGDEKHESYLIVTVGVVLITVLTTQVLSGYYSILISPFVASLVLGVIFTNSLNKEEFEFESEVINGFVPPLITAFFVIAGMELDITQITVFGGFALIYVISHAGGKYLGGFIGTRIVKGTDLTVRKYLPQSTLTQGGFEIFLAASLVTLPFIANDPTALADARLVKSIVLTSVLIIEFFAPLLLTKSLIKAGEASPLD